MLAGALSLDQRSSNRLAARRNCVLTKDEAKRLAGKVLSYSTFPDCDISINSIENAFIRFARNGVTTSGFTIEQSMSITSEREGRAGTTTVGEFDDASLREAVKRTEQLAQISPPSPEEMPSLEPQRYPAQENFAESTARARSDVLIPHVRSIIEAAKTKDLIAAGFFERSVRASAIANKRGNFGYGRTSDARLSATVRNAAGTSSGWASQPAVRIEDIDGAEVGAKAIDKCLRWKNPKRLEPGKYTVVLEPVAVGDLVALLLFAGSFQARSAEEGRSFLSKKGGGTLVGEKLFPENITLRSDPFDRFYSALPWSEPGGGLGLRRGGTGGDDAGLPVAPFTWIEKGVVKNLHYDRYWAAKAGKAVTPAPSYSVLSGGDQTFDGLIASVEHGLLVTRFFYIRMVNPQTVQLTGLTRDGLFLIESGKVAGPAMNFRFNESPVRLLQNTIALGRPVRVRGGEGFGMVAPPLVAKDFSFTSISDAV
jgi:predicted Zn-dependent protease